MLFYAADLPTSDIGTKHNKLAEEEEEMLDKGDEKKSAEEIVWPQPMKRVTPPIRTAVVLPDGVTCPDKCKRFSLSEHPDPLVVNRLRCAAMFGSS